MELLLRLDKTLFKSKISWKKITEKTEWKIISLKKLLILEQIPLTFE